MSADKVSLAIDFIVPEAIPCTPESPKVATATAVACDGGPLAVDLDGTIIKTDLLWESLLTLLKENVFFFCFIPLWAIAGRAHLKRQIATRSTLDVATLPYNEEFIDFLRGEYRRGRELILITASDEILAQRIAEYLGIFAGVLASDGKQNLKGVNKAKALQDR